LFPKRRIADNNFILQQHSLSFLNTKRLQQAYQYRISILPSTIAAASQKPFMYRAWFGEQQQGATTTTMRNHPPLFVAR
jgi:hypothetical protein